MAKNPDNCKSCDTPLVKGECPLCKELESIVSNVTSSDSTPEDNAEKVWNWEAFYQLEGNDELLITAKMSDSDIQSRIEALQELDRKTEILRQSIRIRISVDSTELESRGHRIKKPSTTSKPAVFSTPADVKVSKAPMSKLEKAKANFNSLGIDFDKFTKDLDI